MNPVIWPRTLVPLNCDANLQPRPVGGGPALSGGSQWVQSEAGAWAFNYDSIPVATPRARLLFKAMALQINGPGTPILLPVFSSGIKPWPTIGGKLVKSYGDIPFSDGASFSDGAGFYQPVIVAVLDADAAQNATAVTIRVHQGGVVQAGMGFSLGQRYYEIARAGNAVSDGDDRIYSLSILPELRLAVSAGDVCEFDRPVCLAELTDTGQMQLAGSNSRFATPSVQFQEHFGQ